MKERAATVPKWRANFSPGFGVYVSNTPSSRVVLRAHNAIRVHRMGVSSFVVLVLRIVRVLIRALRLYRDSAR